MLLSIFDISLYCTHSPPRSPQPSNKIDNILGRVTDLPSYQLSSRVPASSRCLFSALRTLHFSVRSIYPFIQDTEFSVYLDHSDHSPSANLPLISYGHVRTVKIVKTMRYWQIRRGVATLSTKFYSTTRWRHVAIPRPLTPKNIHTKQWNISYTYTFL